MVKVMFLSARIIQIVKYSNYSASIHMLVISISNYLPCFSYEVVVYFICSFFVLFNKHLLGTC